jgi:hypothetical protein
MPRKPAATHQQRRARFARCGVAKENHRRAITGEGFVYLEGNGTPEGMRIKSWN